MIRIEPPFTVSQIVTFVMLTACAAFFFWTIAFEAVDKQMAFNEGIRKERCEKDYLAGYCKSLHVAQINNR